MTLSAVVNTYAKKCVARRITVRIINRRCVYMPEINYRNSSLSVYVISMKYMYAGMWSDIKFFVKLVRDL